MITKTGIEGGVFYALSTPLREAIMSSGEAVLHIDLRPDMPHVALEQRLAKPRGKQSLATFLRKAVQLSPADIGLLQEAAHAAKTPLAGLAPEALAALIKSLPLRLIGVAPIARAISSAGGVVFDAVDDHFMLTARPGVFVAGEMLDWEAPTGGYLLQACFATGAAAGRGALGWIGRADGA
jgi:predicted flavoprotein YhiN